MPTFSSSIMASLMVLALPMMYRCLVGDTRHANRFAGTSTGLIIETVNKCAPHMIMHYKFCCATKNRPHRHSGLLHHNVLNHVFCWHIQHVVASDITRHMCRGGCQSRHRWYDEAEAIAAANAPELGVWYHMASQQAACLIVCLHCYMDISAAIPLIYILH